MQQLFTQIIAQPWALPAAIGVVGLLLGLLIASLKKSGSNWLGALLFWPVALLRDLLDAAHTKRLQYYALLLALLGMEAFFSVRAATVYYDVLSTRMAGLEVGLVSTIVGCAVFLCGYMVASHGVRHASGKMDWGNFWIAALVVVHDVAGVVYLNYGPGASGGGDWASISITVGMCLFSLVPFALGNRAEKLRPELEAELEQEVNEFTSAATRTIKRRAVDRVLRLANRTDVIHLVRSLPANEFADFKAFVMPIIAPGLSHNLPDSTGQVDEQAAQIRELSAEIEHLKMLLPPGQGPDTDKLARVSDSADRKSDSGREKGTDNESAGDGQHTTAILFESKEAAVKAAMAANPTGNTKQIATAAGCSVRTAARWMDKLQAAVTN